MSRVTALVRSPFRAIAGSKTLRAALALIVFCGALSSGLAYILVQNGHKEQLEVLARASDQASQKFRDRFVSLNADVVELATRVGEVGADTISASKAESDESSTVANSGKEVSPEAAAPIEVRWRRKLESSIRELATIHNDVLDLTYLGRFAGVPNGELMVVRVERALDGSLRTTEVDPRSDWNAEFLRRVMQGESGVPLVSAPVLPESKDASPHAVMRSATSVVGDDGTVVGLVLISLNLSDLLASVRLDLPEVAVPLLVSDGGIVLLHPDAKLRLTSAKGASRVLQAAYPKLLAAFNAQKDAYAFSYFGGNTAQRLLRFEVGGQASEQMFSLVLSEPGPAFELPSSARLAQVFSIDRVFPENLEVPQGAVAAVVLGLVLVPVAALLVRYRKRWSGALGRGRAAKKASALAERASQIEAENQALVEEVDAREVDAADASDTPDELPDLSTELADSPVVTENVDAAAAEDDAEDHAQEPSTDPALAEDEVAVPQVSEASLESARELATTRNRLEDELEEARQSALQELSAARERFEMELARERERVIDRLVEESRRALASELGELETTTCSATLPGIEDQEFDLRRLLTEVAAWMEGETHGRSSGFDIRCNRNVPDRLRGDPDWIGPLLVHIGRNAVRCSEDGPVELFVSCVDDGAAGIRLCFELCASDTGLETDAEGNLREREACGLQLTEEIVESMRGQLELETTPGSGSILRVVVPMSLPS